MSTANADTNIGGSTSDSWTTLKTEEVLIGLLMVQVAGFFLKNFLILLFYKTFKLTGQSTLSAFILFFLVFMALFVYFRSIPKEVTQNIL